MLPSLCARVLHQHLLSRHLQGINIVVYNKAITTKAPSVFPRIPRKRRFVLHKHLPHSPQHAPEKHSEHFSNPDTKPYTHLGGFNTHASLRDAFHFGLHPTAPQTRTRMTRGMKGNPRDEPLVRTSKTLSWMLRHGAASVGLQMRKDGYVDVQDLLRLQQFRELTFEHLREIVDKDQKQRYNLVLDSETNVWMIRANQGHSMKDVTLDMQKLTAATDVPMAVHGTTEKAWESIQRQGLSRMNRQHIHFAQGVPDSGVISGMRTSSRIIIHIDLARALDAGVTFFVSANGVILTPGNDRGLLLPQFFSRVQRRSADGFEDVQVPVLSPEEAAEAEAEAIRTMETLSRVDRRGKGRGGGRSDGRGRGDGKGREAARTDGEDVPQTSQRKGKDKEEGSEQSVTVEVSQAKTTITTDKEAETVVEGVETISLKS